MSPVPWALFVMMFACSRFDSCFRPELICTKYIALSKTILIVQMEGYYAEALKPRKSRLDVQVWFGLGVQKKAGWKVAGLRTCRASFGFGCNLILLRYKHRIASKS